MPHWKHYEQDYLQSLTQSRAGETKIGDIIRAGIGSSDAGQIVILGIPEDIGIRANLGIGGAATAWNAFLRSFLNIQSTEALNGQNCSILGHLDCSDLQPIIASNSIAALRQAVSRIDYVVASKIEQITALGKLPVIIGGGHNNAYPIIKGAARGYQKGGRHKEPVLNVINLDAHTDFRPTEGRHSGNGFRYAFQEGFLDRYALIGLHRNYNAQSIIDEIAREERIFYTFWEEIFLEEKLDFRKAVEQALQFTTGRICGIELDLDCVENTLSSAMTPSGLSPTLARQYVYQCTQRADPAYLHICEGAVKLYQDLSNMVDSPDRSPGLNKDVADLNVQTVPPGTGPLNNGMVDPTTGKLIAYLVSDFIRALTVKTP